MGRHKKGISKINEMCCLDYSYLTKYKLICNSSISNTLTWCKDGLIYDQIVLENINDVLSNKKQIKLTFCIAEADGNLLLKDQIIEFIEIDSNLGLGRITFFKCPITGQKCRKLYKAKNSTIWRCRNAFENRLYYPLQLCSKIQSYDAKLNAYTLWLNKHTEKRMVTRNRSKLTKRYLLVSSLKEKQFLMNDLRMTPLAMPIALRKLFPKALVERLYELHG